MRRLFTSFGLILVIFLMAKVFFLVDVFNQKFENKQLLSPNEAEAETPAKGTPSPTPEKAPLDLLAGERTLMGQLMAKKKEFEERESQLKLEEQRIFSIKKEIEGKIEILKAQEDKFKSIIDQIAAFEAKAIKDLAKVYETTPPAKAGPMLEKLDVKTAALITMNMKRDKAGALWGHISPQKAADITKEITAIGSKKIAP